MKEVAQEPLPEKLPPDDPGLIASGEPLFFHHCARCHSYRGSEGAYPNLWNMNPGTHAAFKQIVLDGAMSWAGMAPFDDVLNEKDTEAIYAFIVNDQVAMREEGEEGEPEKRELGF